ncbi:MAG: hypothetical protein KAT33_08055 [Bacteroidales bacterium]|nr:hypothetical protein [Bacteroidales bacterium]
MKKNLTLSDLILYAFRETKFSINKPMQKIDYLNVSPSERVIKNILNYSRSLSVFKSKITGNINLILN